MEVDADAKDEAGVRGLSVGAISYERATTPPRVFPVLEQPARTEGAKIISGSPRGGGQRESQKEQGLLHQGEIENRFGGRVWDPATRTWSGIENGYHGLDTDAEVGFITGSSTGETPGDLREIPLGSSESGHYPLAFKPAEGSGRRTTLGSVWKRKNVPSVGKVPRPVFMGSNSMVGRVRRPNNDLNRRIRRQRELEDDLEGAGSVSSPGSSEGSSCSGEVDEGDNYIEHGAYGVVSKQDWLTISSIDKEIEDDEALRRSMEGSYIREQ